MAGRRTRELEEAAAIMAQHVHAGAGALVNVSRAAAERPADRQVQALFTRTLVDLDRDLRFWRGLDAARRRLRP